MRCDQFEDRLNDVLDRRDDPCRDARLVAHAAVCRNCRDLAATYEMLTVGAAELRNDVNGAPLELLVEPRSRWVAVAGPLLAIAAIAVFALVRPAWKNTDVTKAIPTAIVPTVAAVTVPMPSTSEVVPSTVFDLARTTGQAYVGLIHGTARGVDEALALATALPHPQQLLQPMLFPEDGLIRRMEHRWAPVAGETFDALRQVFQPDESQRL